MKKAWITGAGVLAFLTGAFYGIGNYFVRFALVQGRAAATPELGDEAETELSPKQRLVQERIAKNRALQAEKTKVWLEHTEQEQVSVLSEDGLRLAGTLFLNEKMGHKWAILIHGYKGSRKETQGLAQNYAGRGYQVLTPDLRSHGESQGHYIGMGWPDRLDILRWVDLIIHRDPEAEIVIHGVSMGAATAMMLSGESLPEQVKVFIEDCGYTSVWDIFKLQLKDLFGLPTFPLLYVAELVARIQTKNGFREGSALKQVAKCKRPMLFIHGSEDTFVPAGMIEPLYEAAGCEKERLIVEGAGHAEARSLNPALYLDTVFTFIEKHTGSA